MLRRMPSAHILGCVINNVHALQDSLLHLFFSQHLYIL